VLENGVKIVTAKRGGVRNRKAIPAPRTTSQAVRCKAGNGVRQAVEDRRGVRRVRVAAPYLTNHRAPQKDINGVKTLHRDRVDRVAGVRRARTISALRTMNHRARPKVAIGASPPRQEVRR